MLRATALALVIVALLPSRIFAGDVSDFNADGKSDIVLRNYGNGANAIWMMNGAQISTIVDIVGLPNTDYDIVGSGDFNHDGKPDLVLHNHTTGANAIWLLDGTTLLAIVDLPALPTDKSIRGVGDFNGDGEQDLVIFGTDRSVWFWFMHGTTFVSVAPQPIFSGATCLSPPIPTHDDLEGVGDFDGDGHPDLLVRDTVTGKNEIRLMNGISETAAVCLPTLANTDYSFVAVADYNGDGKPDIVLHNRVTGQNAIWIMNGTSYSATIDLPGVTNTNIQITAPR